MEQGKSHWSNSAMIVTLIIIYILSACVVYVDAHNWMNETNEPRSLGLLFAVVAISSMPVINTAMALNVIYCYILNL
jgi:hypothetical protein